jgi:tetratricopeptide (TPR) repeat protein
MNAAAVPPDNFQHALALLESGRIAHAQAAFEEILRKQPRHADALHLLGLIAARSNDPKKAAVLIGKSVQIDASNPVAYLNRGAVLQELELWEEALGSYEQALALHPAFAAVYFNRGNALQSLQRLDEALASYNQAIAIQPYYHDAWLNRGNLLVGLKQWDGALASYNRAIVVRTDSAVAHANRGNVLKELNRLDEARASYDRAIAIQPDYPEAHTNRGVASLLAGEFERGWTDFEWRWKIKYTANRREKHRTFRQPLWLGQESLAGKSILLHSEQGLGDTLQFCRYVPLVANLGAKVILEVQKPLWGVLAGLEGVSQWVGQGAHQGGAAPETDYHCPLLSLPLAFKTRLDTIPPPARYLRGAADKVAHWQAKLGAASMPRIGLAWSGGTHRPEDNRRIPLADLIRHLPQGFQYVSLQKELPESERQTLRSNPAVLDIADDLNFDNTAALCECLDLVISIDTSVAHLSGALGKRTWILLAFNPDWRWLLGRTDSPWYPSATLYRQESIGNWNGVLSQVAADLQRIFAST